MLRLSFIFQEDCPGEVPCVFPSIGEFCEKQQYSIPLDGLVSKFKHIGNHNRNYFFEVTVINNAGHVTTEHLDILIDESSPQTGVVLEGMLFFYIKGKRTERIINWRNQNRIQTLENLNANNKNYK